MERFNPATAAQSLPGLVKDSHTCRYTNVGELTKAIQIKVFGGRGNVTQQGDLSALIKIKFSPPLSSLNLASLSLLHISVCSMFPITFPLSFLSLSTFLDFLLLLFPPILPFFCPSRPFCSPPSAVVSLGSLLSSAFSMINSITIKLGVYNSFYRLLKSKRNTIKM